MTRSAIAALFALLSVLALVPAAPAKDEVLVDVVSICASTQSAGRAAAPAVDPKLASFSKKLLSLFAYNRYAFLGKSQTMARYGGASVIQLPERFSLEVAPERLTRGESDRIEMMVTLLRDVGEDTPAPGRGRAKSEVVLRTKIRLENGGTVLLGGPPIARGVLILALSARG